MRLDHYALRVPDRNAAAEIYCDALGFKIIDELEPFPNTRSYALQPPEVGKALERSPIPLPFFLGFHHTPAEVFISDGQPGSVIHDWVHKERGGRGGLHHIAVNVENIEGQMEQWARDYGFSFLSKEPIESPGIRQIFTDEIPELGDLIIELITREPGVNFTKANVRKLMDSTRHRGD